MVEGKEGRRRSAIRGPGRGRGAVLIGQQGRCDVDPGRIRVRSWQRLGPAWWAGVAYAGLTVVMTWPMAARLSLPYARIEGDFGLWLWNLWWMKKALVDLRASPYFTSYIFHPTGTSLVFHNLSPYNGLVGIPLQLLGADVITTHNLLYLSSFVIGGCGMFLLVRELTGNTFASFFAGAVYAFSPFHTILYYWTNLWSTQWLPFALLFAVRILKVGRLVDGVGLAVALALATLTDWHQPVLLLLAIMVLTLSASYVPRQKGLVRQEMLRRMLLSVLLYGFLVSPIGILVLKELVLGDTILQTASSFAGFELLGVRVRPGGDVISYAVLLGWASVALTTYGITHGLDFWMKCFLALLVVFFVLSLGEGLRLPGLAEPVLPLPFLLWRKIPLLGIIRGSFYFWIMVQVCVAVLAGHGVRRLWERAADWRLGKFALSRPALGVCLLAFMVVEVVQAPLTPVPLRIHPVYEAIRNDSAGEAVLDAPIRYTLESTPQNAGRSMYLQTLHNRPLVGGYTNFDGRKRLSFLEQNRVVRLFSDRWIPRNEGSLDGTEGLPSFLADHRIGWLILRKAMREDMCDQGRTRIPGWTCKKFINLVAPAVVNKELRSVWQWPVYCGDWDEQKIQRADALVRSILGPPVWDDDGLVAYRVR